MPLHEGKLVELVNPPDVSDGETVWIIRFTGEIFQNYEDYLKRLAFYRQRVFKCSISKVGGLTYEEALIKELNMNKKAEELQECYLRIICEMAHGSQLRVSQLVSQIYQRIQTEFFEGEVLTTIKGKKRLRVMINKVEKDNIECLVLSDKGRPLIGLDKQPVNIQCTRNDFLYVFFFPLHLRLDLCLAVDEQKKLG
eukprot:TRINITY_DN1581_c1_g1_i4.p1 TRINITY_DN1581_c1_g1~~TRINITY_DN1581_c1_g1_i4.p1  ORF type:complete len:196 (-),score=36.58 TRINITY_DN1581_c1_g1_i4:173-760(-)